MEREEAWDVPADKSAEHSLAKGDFLNLKIKAWNIHLQENF